MTKRFSDANKVEGSPAAFPSDRAEADWRERLSPEQFRVLRQHGTERAGSSALNHEKRTGVFSCLGCGQALFLSDTKAEVAGLAFSSRSKVRSRPRPIAAWA